MSNTNSDNAYLLDVQSAAAAVCSMAAGAILRGYSHQVYMSDGSYEDRLIVAEDNLIALIATRRRARGLRK